MLQNDLQLIRLTSKSKQTTGSLVVHDALKDYARFTTIELPSINNQKNISCIPPGTYKAKKILSNTFGWCIHILNVPNRTGILIHSGNFYTNTKGCILVGESFAKINNDSQTDITNSKKSIALLTSFFIPEKEFIISIQPAIINSL